MAKHIALFLHALSGGGVQRATINLAGALVAMGHRVDLVVGSLEGPSRSRVPATVRIVPLKRCFRWQFWGPALRADPGARDLILRPVILPLLPQRAFYYLPALVRYLRNERPDVLVSAGTHYNLVAVWARRLAGVATEVIISERSALAPKLAERWSGRAWRWRYILPLITRTYPEAAGIVTVSEGLADQLARLGVARERITTIHNPVFTGRDMEELADRPVPHPWLQPGEPPVVLAVGRLAKVKAFDVLVRVFARVRANRSARLVIVGGEQDRGLRGRLLRLAGSLGVASDVDLPGFADNPYAFMARAGVLVLSSVREGFPNVVAEALACGCPVVSTDCPFGPAEILDEGRFGRLVPVGDEAAMAAAIEATLDEPIDRPRLREWGRAFSAERAARSYLALLDPPSAPSR
ncbi:MAG: glycosyltransferase [Alphaproteobacteria bacterium]|nr:glycosyltransferase [Alphaproteobacteria bacterium]